MFKVEEYMFGDENEFMSFRGNGLGENVEMFSVEELRGCPKCKILRDKLEAKHIKFGLHELEDWNIDPFIKTGHDDMPLLILRDFDNNAMGLSFKEAIDWVNGLEDAHPIFNGVDYTIIPQRIFDEQEAERKAFEEYLRESREDMDREERLNDYEGFDEDEIAIMDIIDGVDN